MSDFETELNRLLDSLDEDLKTLAAVSKALTKLPPPFDIVALALIMTLSEIEKKKEKSNDD